MKTEDIKGAPEGDFLPEGTKVIRDMEYRKLGGMSLLMNVYIHGSPRAELPVILYMHGGGWRTNSRINCPRALELLVHGYAVASINYRLTNIAPFPAQLEDCKEAVRFLRAKGKNYGLLTNRIGAMGVSAGGHLASLLGTTAETKEFDRGENLDFSSSIQAVCNFYGPSSINELGRFAEKKGNESLKQVVEKLIGGPLDRKKKTAEKASPLNYIHKNAAPFLIIHGDRDPVVPVSQSEMLHKALLEAGVESHLYIVKGGIHGGEGFINSTLLVRKISSFFNSHIKKSV
ncbi:MAG TPA: alpha/beta hydrolase [bacterium]|nr:alpha/beta hydrolase [bacterium]